MMNNRRLESMGMIRLLENINVAINKCKIVQNKVQVHNVELPIDYLLSLTIITLLYLFEVVDILIIFLYGYCDSCV